MAKPKIVEKGVPDPAAMNAETPMEYASRGWLFFSNHKYDRAVDDFRHILDVDKNDLDAWYGLGLSLKAAGSSDEAVEAFNHVLGLISVIENKQRASVLERLAKGQVNLIRTGDWNLEKEVWKRS